MRPRLSEFLQWQSITPPVKRRLDVFFKNDTSQASAAYRGLLITVTAALEQAIRRLIRDAIISITEREKPQADIEHQLTRNNIYYTGRLLTTIHEPLDHLDIDFARLCRNLGSCSDPNNVLEINPEAFSAFTVKFEKNYLDDVLKRTSLQVNWDQIANHHEFREIFSISKSTDTRKTAKEIELYIKELGRKRNRSAHGGAGGEVILASDVTKAIKFSRTLVAQIRTTFEKQLTNRR